MTTPLVFFGSDRFSAVVLSELIALNSTPTLVVTDHPKPKGKYGTIEPNQVELLANSHNIKVLYYKDNKEYLINFIEKEKPTGLSASFPHLFPPSIITAFDSKLYNLHPSLLPQYRNVAPGPYAIAMGDSTTGISLFSIGIGIDNGELVAQQKENILLTDTTTSLLTRLFTIGTKLFLKYLNDPNNPTLTGDIPIMRSLELIFTRKLTRESGFIEWDVVQKLIANKPINLEETKNPLIKLRLTHHPERTKNILPDLIRALDGYERVWTNAKTKNGTHSTSITFSDNQSIINYKILIPGKPRAIPYTEFVQYYLR